MDRAVVRAVREAIANVDFSEIEKRLNVKISLQGGGSFDPTPKGSAVWKIEATPIINGEVLDKEAMTFKRLATTYGLEPSDLGETFLSRGVEFRITGLAPRRYKMPISAERVSDKKGYKFGADAVCMALGREVPPALKRW